MKKGGRREKKNQRSRRRIYIRARREMKRTMHFSSCLSSFETNFPEIREKRDQLQRNRAGKEPFASSEITTRFTIPFEFSLTTIIMFELLEKNQKACTRLTMS